MMFYRFLTAIAFLSMTMVANAQIPSDGKFSWKVEEPFLQIDSSRLPKSSAHPWIAVKDPSIVRHNDRWHLFCTLRKNKQGDGRIRIGYLSFAEWSQAKQATWSVLHLTPGYHAAPQIFWFEPHKTWYLIYQAEDAARGLKYGPCYSTNDDISKPEQWTLPKPLYVVPEGTKAGLDFWVICDDTKAHLFFTSLDGHMWRTETATASFPDRNWSTPKVALKADIFEASHIYKLAGEQRFLTVVEAQGNRRRYFKAFVADSLDAHWKPLASTPRKPLVSPVNVVNQQNSWATSYSHGEFVRLGSDQRMEIDPNHLTLLFQGANDEEYRNRNYGQIPWRLGLLTPAISDDTVWIRKPTEADRKQTPGLIHETFLSRSMNTTVGYSVVLPPNYHKSKKRYPVVYWLHGGGGNECSNLSTSRSWEKLYQKNEIEEVILVYPNGFRSGYMDHADGKVMVESMIIKELIPRIDRKYRTHTDRSSRAVHGFSMGASGALKFAIKYPYMFCSAVAYGGGAIDLETTDMPFVLKILKKNLDMDPQLIRQNNTYHFLEKNHAEVRRQKIDFLLICGEKDPWMESAVSFEAALQAKEISCELKTVANVGHSIDQLTKPEGLKAARFQDKVFRRRSVRSGSPRNQLGNLEGISDDFPGDVGIEKHPSVLFVEDFEQDSLEQLGKRWETFQNSEITSLSLETPPTSTGKQSLLMSQVAEKGNGAALYRRLDDGYERVFTRMYVKFADDCEPVHHFGTCVGGNHPSTPWPMVKAGQPPKGDRSFWIGIEPFGKRWTWDYYAYWCDMRGSPPRGQTWGNKFIQDSTLKVRKGRWTCIEVMVDVNQIGDTDGELALWIDGQLVSHLGKGFPLGTWTFDKFNPGQEGEGVRWNQTEGKRENYRTAPGGDPFEGFRFRTDKHLNVNFVWLYLYLTTGTPGHTNRVWFDDVVVAKEYIGPITVLTKKKGA